ncbi:Protein of unknown function [Gryllus bimaculatus]|nr:Protein of unknown function [Gryllus bimaculatus]
MLPPMSEDPEGDALVILNNIHNNNNNNINHHHHHVGKAAAPRLLTRSASGNNNSNTASSNGSANCSNASSPGGGGRYAEIGVWKLRFCLGTEISYIYQGNGVKATKYAKNVVNRKCHFQVTEYFFPHGAYADAALSLEKNWNMKYKN